MVLVAKFGAGIAGGRIVRSTKTPPSPCSTRSAANAAASPVNAEVLKQTVTPPVNSAVVLMSNDRPASIVNPSGSCDGDGGGINEAVVVPPFVTLANVNVASGSVTVTFCPTGV